nr:SNF2 domain-containing protein CLASSY 3-like isoform X1 [Ipomoea batatas]GMC85151.1 SNF2 domain-containing protein CLASSY 3-like isoform X1 [Ipomoea batatas]
MNGRKIYTRRQWDNYYREWNEEKKRKLSQSCESSGFSGNGSSEHGCCEKGVDGNGKSSEFAEGIDVPGDGSTSTMLGKIVGEKSRLSGSSSNGDNFSFKEGLNRNKKKRRKGGSEMNDPGDYTELLIDSTDPHLDSSGTAVDKNMKGKEKEQRVSGSLLDKKNAYFDTEKCGKGGGEKQEG